MSIYKCASNDKRSASYEIKVGKTSKKFCSKCSVEMLYGALSCIQEGEEVSKIEVKPIN